MNDEELIKCLVKSSELKCSQCLQYSECNSDDCEKVIAEKALDLINRQQAEIERLNGNLFTISNACMQRRNEAIKEFAERIKAELSFGKYITAKQIDEILLEMAGEQNA